MIKLGVNIDHVATLRQARGVDYPDPAEAAVAAERAGASAITFHLREDRRHVRDSDLPRIRDAIRIHLNQEMAPVAEMVEIAMELKPDEVCLVPERREEVTTEGGLDAAGLKKKLRPIIDRLKMAGIGVSLFIDPELHQVEAAAMLGADYVELHTGTYANLADSDLRENMTPAQSAPIRRDEAAGGRAKNERSASRSVLGQAARHELGKIERAVNAAQELKLKPNAGHGLNYRNVTPIVAISGLQWLHIGHAIVARALMVGMEQAVAEMRDLLNGGAPRRRPVNPGRRVAPAHR